MSVDSSYVYPTDITVDQLNWIAGSWIGEGLGGQCEEIWSPPKNGHMLCLFRFDQEGELVFSEHCSISEQEDGIHYRVRHFSADFSAWEDEETYVDFPLIRLDGQTAYFEGATINRTEDTLTIYVMIDSKDGAHEVPFVYELRE